MNMRLVLISMKATMKIDDVRIGYKLGGKAGCDFFSPVCGSG